MTNSGNLIGSFISQTHEGKKNLWRNNLVLLISLLLVIFFLPVIKLPSEILNRVILGVAVISGIFAAEFGRKIFGILLFLGLVVLIAMVLGILFPAARFIDVIGFLLLTLSFLFSTIALVTHVAGHEKVDRSTIICAINSYLLIGLSGSVLIYIIDLVIPSSLPALESGVGGLSGYIYFGFVTLSTLGYGDISPQEPLIRSFSTFLALSGQLYLVIIMAFIIGKYLNSKNQSE